MERNREKDSNDEVVSRLYILRIYIFTKTLFYLDYSTQIFPFKDELQSMLRKISLSSHPFHLTELKLIAAHFNYFANVDIELFPGGPTICHPKEQGGNLKVVPHNERHGVLRVKVRLWVFHNSSCQLTPTGCSICLGEEKFENLIVEPVVAEKGQVSVVTNSILLLLLAFHNHGSV